MRGSFVAFAGLVVLLTTLDTIDAQSAGSGCCEDYCYDTDNERPQSLRFSTKTAYELVRGKQSVRQYVVPSK